jgi:competence protein ComEC
LLTNIAVITLVPVVIGLGVGTLVFSFWDFAYNFLSQVLILIVRFMNRVVIFVESLPYSVTENISLSICQVVVLYPLIILFFATFFYKNKTLLLPVLGCALLVMGMDVYRQRQIDNQQELTFYSIRSGYAIDCIEKRHSILVFDSTNIRKQIVYDYNIKPNHIRHRIKTRTKTIGRHSVDFHATKVCIIDRPLSAVPDGQKPKVDCLLLSNNLNISVDTLRQRFDFTMIITDGSYSNAHLERIRQDCAQKAIPFHDLKHQGSLTIDLTIDN